MAEREWQSCLGSFLAKHKPEERRHRGAGRQEREPVGGADALPWGMFKQTKKSFMGGTHGKVTAFPPRYGGR